eukprot:m.122258 g.122258  ORF g.122258 m.122258 type:complete len:95 (+) comp37772_c0_seq1:72-356(+)
MVLIIDQGLLFLSFFLFFGAVTITPSGTLRGKDGQRVSVNCTFPARAGIQKFEFNSLTSGALDSMPGMRNIESVGSGASLFVVESFGWGLNTKL